MIKKWIIFLFLIIVIQLTYSQDTIEFIDGNIIFTNVVSVDEDNTHVLFNNQSNIYDNRLIFAIRSSNKNYNRTNYNKILLKNGVVYYSYLIHVVDTLPTIKFIAVKKGTEARKEIKIKKTNLFSIETKEEEILMFYQHDTLYSNDFFTEEEMYRAILGKQYAKQNFKCNLVGLGGFASGLAGGTIGFGGLLAPALYTTLIGIKDAKIKEPMYSDNYLYHKYYYDEFFRSGYQITANNKRFKRAILSGILGFAVSAIYFDYKSMN